MGYRIRLAHPLAMHYIKGMDDESPDHPNAVGMDLECIAQALQRAPAIISCANPNCKKLFRQKRHWQKFCSVQCRNDKFWSEHKRLTITTQQHKPIETTKT